MFASDSSGFAVTWSSYVEQEADRHLRSGQTPVQQVRQSVGRELSPKGDRSGYIHTKASDRQVLADAVAARARFIISEDVDDFAMEDLSSAGIAVVNPDLFLAERVSTDAYSEAVRRMAASMARPPRTPEELHIAIGRQHPRTVVAHQAAFGAQPSVKSDYSPAVLYRGAWCLRCGRQDSSLVFGVCADCLRD